MFKGLAVLILCFVIIALLSPVFAVEYATDLPPDLDANAVRQEAADWINDSAEPVARSRPVTIDDVDLSKAFKYYNSYGIFDISETNFETVKELLVERGYIYNVPVYLDGNTWMAGITNGVYLNKSLTEVLTGEDIAYLESKAGQWYVYSIGCYESEIVNPYRTAGEMAGITDKEPLIVGNIPAIQNTWVAIFPDAEGNLGKMVTLSPLYPDQAGQARLGIKDAILAQDLVVMDYSRAKEVLNVWPDGSGARSEIAILVLIILVLFVIVLLAIRRNSRKKQTGQRQRR